MHANRGMVLEQLIEISNDQYRRQKVAEIRKVPTPVKILKTNRRGMVNGFVEKKGTVDFEGIANFGLKPIPIAFDAKETKKKSLPIENVADHQWQYMKNFKMLGGKAFILVHFTDLNRYFRLDSGEAMKYIENPWPNNKKSFPIKFFEQYGIEIIREGNKVLDYLKEEKECQLSNK